MRECIWPRRRGGGYAFHMASQAIDLDAWIAGPLGGMLIEQERAIVADSLECAFGLHCLQVGAWGAVRHLSVPRAHAPHGARIEPPAARRRARRRAGGAVAAV